MADSLEASIVDANVVEAAHKLGLNFELKKEQIAAVNRILNGVDVLGVLPTGYGKSVIYALLPPCYDLITGKPGHIVLVISPLISLMEDQIITFNTHGIKAASISENQTNPEIRNDIWNGRYPIVLLSPESLFKGGWRDMLLQDVYQQLLCAIVVDEAHCVADWGKEFRTDYKQVRELRALVPGKPVLALTATASPHARKEIKKLLGMTHVSEIVVSGDRPNIKYICVKASYDMKENFAWLVDMLRMNSTNMPKCILYCRSISKVAVMYDMLISALDNDAYIGEKTFKNCLVAMYHRATATRNKKHVSECFPQLNSILRIVVATSAFGMGVNIPDVQYVLHWAAPRTIESFYQEAGRAGRDGRNSKSIVYFHATDVSTRMTDERMALYCKDDKTCRRSTLLDYFTPDNKGVAADMPHLCCDVCSSECSCGMCPVETELQLQGPIQASSRLDDESATDPEHQQILRKELIDFRSSYEQSTFLPTGCYSGLDDETVDMICACAHEITHIEDLFQYIFSKDVAKSVFEIITNS